ncbi:hypothetical protein NZD89_22745 [Alicyclobacillus fastidiosus]|uniref:Uncharacterized protein n=1 Tax=Alicyclobacillus fastidiosus TaxID=392011 RepID=A0ABY6ZE36_9BACL|nr:hypothetical protein [Alicyclobacillus fastidiosus]WAH41068.1 hypothetical protein NZD89_22745 [Alicyclobacillus fastidiosus]
MKLARFQQLRWVPILVRAYYDAQRMNSETSNALKPTVAKSARSGTDVSVTPRGPRKQNQSAKRNTPKKPVPSSSQNKLASLLREIRMVNRNLRGLGDIRQQLKNLGISIEELNSRLDTVKANDEPTSSTVLPGGTSSPPPMPPLGINRGHIPLHNDGSELPLGERTDNVYQLPRL